MFLKQHPLNQRLPSQAGYTILEGLMAVVVVSVLLVAIGPVIAFSVGTRVQAKRVELATQAARTYIDGVKSGAIPAPTVGNVQPAVAPVPTDITKLYCVDFDGDKDNDGKPCETTSPVDMVVQGLAYHPSPSQTSTTQSYLLGVRVYRANSFTPGVTLKQPTADNPLKSDSLTTNALGNRSLPLVVMKTEVLPPDATFEDLQKRLNP